jgi:hypothetical protein
MLISVKDREIHRLLRVTHRSAFQSEQVLTEFAF